MNARAFCNDDIVSDDNFLCCCCSSADGGRKYEIIWGGGIGRLRRRLVCLLLSLLSPRSTSREQSAIDAPSAASMSPTTTIGVVVSALRDVVDEE